LLIKKPRNPDGNIYLDFADLESKNDDCKVYLHFAEKESKE